MKNNTFSGWIFILLLIVIGSLFTASWVFLWKANTVSIWILPMIGGLVLYPYLFIQLLVPVIRDYRRPKTQRQSESDKPFYQAIVVLVLMYICVSIAFGGMWVYFLKNPITGITMGGVGLCGLAIPLCYLIVVAIRTFNK